MARPGVLTAYAALGAVAGLVSALFIHSIYGFEEFFEKHVKGGYYVQHAPGMLLVGIMLYAMLSRYGHYYVEGVGYATIQDVLNACSSRFTPLLLLFASETAGDFTHAWLGRFRRSIFPRSFPGSRPQGRFWRGSNHLFPALNSVRRIRRRGMGGVVGGFDRRGHGGHRHDLRDDAGLYRDRSA